MVWSIVSAKRRRRLIEQASRARRAPTALKTAWAAVIVYNCVGLLDIYSTSLGLASGAGEEVNPVIAAAMAHFGAGWIVAKLALQVVISFMVLWFPHRAVLAIFSLAVLFNAGVVCQNFVVAGFF